MNPSDWLTGTPTGIISVWVIVDINDNYNTNSTIQGLFNHFGDDQLIYVWRLFWPMLVLLDDKVTRRKQN